MHFLEDVAENIRIDFVVVCERTIIEVPLILVEEGEYALEGLVRYLDVRIPFLQGMYFE